MKLYKMTLRALELKSGIGIELMSLQPCTGVFMPAVLR